MRIIETRRAPNPRRVDIFLAEKGIEVPREQRDLMAGELKTQDFTALNPWQRVPVLVLGDGCVITESVAICRYFEEIQPDPPLFGVGPLGRVQVEMWQRRVELGLFSAVASAFRHLHPKMAANEVPQITPWGEANRAKAVLELELLDARLAASRYLVGSDFSIADITALVAIDFMAPARIEMPAGLGNVARWYAEVSARPSTKR